MGCRATNVDSRKRPVSLDGLSELEDGPVVGCEVVSESALLNLLRLSFEVLLFDAAVGDVVPFEVRPEGPVGVGDAVDLALLFDAAGESFPLDPLAGFVGDGSETVGQIARRVLGGGVPADAGVEAERSVELSLAGIEPGVFGGPASFRDQIGRALFDALFHGGGIAASDEALLLQLFDVAVEVVAFGLMPERGEHGASGGDRRELACELVALSVRLLQLPTIGAVLGLEAF